MWDYPRPPRVEPLDALVVVEFGGHEVARTNRAVRVLETSHPPGIYLPRDDFADGALSPARGRSFCEWKGTAAYFDILAGGQIAHDAAWTYPRPTPEFEEIAHHVSVYPGRVDRCLVDGELVEPQEGDFYGGWITGQIDGPFKGAPGTGWW